jgi:hypothetical protein
MKLTNKTYKIVYLDNDGELFTVRNKNNGNEFDIYFSALEFDAWLETEGYEEDESEQGYIQITKLGMYRMIENKETFEEKKHKISADNDFVLELSRYIAESYNWNSHAQAEHDYLINLQNAKC